MAVLLAVAALVITGRDAHANPGAVESLAGCNTDALSHGDDSNFSDAVPLGFQVNFFGETYNNVYVNNNGNVTFDGGLSQFTAEDLLGTNHVIIAPFWADVDTTSQESGVTTYGATNYGGHSAFCVNWVNVGYFASHVDKTNSFQLLLVDRSDSGAGDFDMIMNFDRVQWEAGDITGSDGFAEDCGRFTCASARLGYSNGVDEAFQYPGSNVFGAFLDSAPTGLAHNSRNSLVAGRYIFEVRNGAPPSGGIIKGVVVGPSQIQGAAPQGNLVPMANALVTACATPPCLTTNTNSAGEFTFTGVPAGNYHVIAYPPAGRGDLIPADAAFTLGQDEVKDIGTLTMRTPLPAPQGFVIENIGSIGGAPVLDWSQSTDFSIPGCVGGTGTWVLRATDGTMLDSGTLTESPPGTYSGTIQPLVPYHGPARLEIDIDCPSGPDESTDIDVYIDPSGVVKTVGGSPIQGATVTLYRSDSAAGPFEAVPDGSAVMSPSNRSNPDTTDENGAFHWDVIAGYYIVRAEKAGCVDPQDENTPYVETDVLTIPPPVTNLDLRLSCGSAVTQKWGDNDCNGLVNLGDSIGLARFLVSLPVDHPAQCPDLGSSLSVASAQAVPQGELRVWGDVNCSGSVSLGDAIAIARFLVSLSVDKPAGCPSLGANVTLG